MSKRDLDRTVGKEIQRLRVLIGFSQEELADRAGLSRTYISQLERGLKSPSVRALDPIARALDTTMSDLLRTVEDALRPNRR
jgi:transcriptional regulator with XRE-family HTH domain